MCTYVNFSPFFFHLMKEKIETKHFEHTFAVLGTNCAAECHSSPNRSRCVRFTTSSHGFYRVMSVKYLFSPPPTYGVHLASVRES